MAKEKEITPWVDGFTQLEAGMNSGISPQLLPKNQAAFASNVTFRGTFAKNRPPVRKMALNFGGDEVLESLFKRALFQGGCYFRPDIGQEQLVAQIGGRTFSVIPDIGASALVSDVSITDDLNPSSINQAWLWQSEKWVIINDGQSLPIFYNGTTSRRSKGQNSTVVGTTAANFTIPAAGSQVEIQVSSPWAGPIGFPVFIDGDQYTTVSSRSATAFTGFTITLKNIYGGDGSTVPALSNVYGPVNYVSFLTASFLMPKKFTGSNVIQVEDESKIAPDQIGIAHVAEPFTGVLPNWTYIGGRLMYINSVHDGGLTLHVLNTVWNDTNPFTVAAGTRVGFLGNAQVVAFTEQDFISPVVGGQVTVKVKNEYVGKIGQYVIIGNQQYQVTAKGTLSATNYYLTVTNVDGNAGDTVTSPADITVVTNELPPGKMGVYGLGRNWMALTDGRQFLATDIVGGSSGTPGEQNRDAVLNITENTLLAGGGNFVVPGNIGDIRAMRFQSTLDVSLGQGPLEVFTSEAVFSCIAPVDRTIWATITNPILTQSLIGAGALSQNGTINANNDIIFRSVDGIRSLVLARREFNTWGNTPQSREVQSILDLDDPTLTQFESEVEFDNRTLLSCVPTSGPLGVFCQGVIALNFDPVSSLRGKSASIYDGFWTGLNVFQFVSGLFGGVKRAFAFCYDVENNEIVLYELLKTDQENFDNTNVPIQWVIESPSLLRDVKGKGTFELGRLIDGELYFADLVGVVNVQVFYRPDYDQCWHKWHNFSMCAAGQQPPEGVAQYRTRIGIGSPSIEDCDSVTNKPFAIGRTFQMRLQITGKCTLMAALVKATKEDEQEFAPVICAEICQ